MSEKDVAVHCKTEEEWGKVLVKIGKVNNTVWGKAFYDYTNPCIDPDDPSTCEKSYFEDRNYTIISAQEYLNEEEFKVGDRVECVDTGRRSCGSSNGEELGLEFGEHYTVSKIDKDNHIKLKEINKAYSPRSDRFKLVNNKPKTTEETMKASNVNKAVKAVYGGKDFSGDDMLLVDEMFGEELLVDVLSIEILRDKAKKILELAKKAKEEAEK